MKTKTLFYLLALAIAMLVIILGCSCDRDDPDVVPPSVPSGISYTATTSSITLSWTASTDNIKVVGYKIFRDGVLAGNATGTSFTDDNLVPNSSYVYTIAALDAANNVSKLSQPYTAETVDDPTSSKWMSEIIFVAPITGSISAGEEKSAGSLIIKNISTSSHTANLTLSFTSAIPNLVDSLNYTVGGQTVKQELTNNSITLNQISIPAKSSTEIKLVYRIKEIVPLGTIDQSQITLAVTATTTDEIGVTKPRNRIFPSVNLDKLKVYTAQIDFSKSYEASAVAEDKILFGNSVAKAFVLEVTTPGTIRLEVIGKMNDKSPAVKYFWINDKDDTDFYTSVSTLKPIYPKTNFDGKNYVEVPLKVGTNVIAFKTNPFSKKIINASKVGLKVIGAGFSFSNDSYSANSLVANVAGKVKVTGIAVFGLYFWPQSAFNDFFLSRLHIFPQKEDGTYDENAQTKISGVGLNTEDYAKKYPKLFFAPSDQTPPDFKANFRIFGALFGKDIGSIRNGYGLVFSEELDNNIVKYENNIILFSGEPQEIFLINEDHYGLINFMLNAYNADTEYCRPPFTTVDPASTGWKFLGNPELELWTENRTKPAIRIQ